MSCPPRPQPPDTRAPASRFSARARRRGGVPLHLQEAYRGLGYGPGDFPVTERVAAEIVSLPMFPQLTAKQQSQVANALMALLSAPVQA